MLIKYRKCVLYKEVLLLLKWISQMGLKNAVFMSDTFVSSYSSHACYSGWI